MITDEMLYAAAEDAAERFLEGLPGQEDCGHEFSAEFEEKMRPLLQKTERRRRPWRGLLAAAAIIGVLAAVTAGAGQEDSCQVYWSQDGETISYAIQVEHSTALEFRPMALDYVPEGYALTGEQTSQGRSDSYTASYADQAEGTFRVTQEEQNRHTGILAGAYTAENVEIGSRTGVLIREADTGWQMLLWADGPYVLTVTGSGLSREEIMGIAEGVHW